MSREEVFIIARKEIKEIVLNKGSWTSALLLAVFFSVTNVASVMSQEGGSVGIDGTLVYISMFIGVFTGFLLCGAVFYREKQSGVIETLLSTPLNLRTIWLGKVVGVTVPAYMMALISVGLISGLMIATGADIRPLQPLTVVHLAMSAPLLTAASIGLVGYVQLALGMRENRLINFGVFALLIVGLTTSSGAVSSDLGLLQAVVLGVLLVSAGLLALVYGLTSRLRKEKIITAIPD